MSKLDPLWQNILDPRVFQLTDTIDWFSPFNSFLSFFLYILPDPISSIIGRCSCNSYTMGCPPVRGDYPRALASEISYVQVDNQWYNYFIPPISV